MITKTISILQKNRRKEFKGGVSIYPIKTNCGNVFIDVNWIWTF